MGIHSVLRMMRLPVPFDMLYVELVSEKGEVCLFQNLVKDPLWMELELSVFMSREGWRLTSN